MAGFSAPPHTNAEWNGIPIRCSAKGGTAQIHTRPERCTVQLDFGEDAAHTIVMEADELLLWSDALGIEGNRKWDIGACIEIRIASERDRVAVWVTQQHSSSNSSETSTSSSSNGASKRERSSSTSTSIWTDVNYFDIAVWNGKRIELSLEGGDFVECAIDRGRGRCEVEFNIDEGKRKRTIRLESGVVTVDGKPLETDGDYSEILIEATRRSLKITADGDVIGKWK